MNTDTDTYRYWNGHRVSNSENESLKQHSIEQLVSYIPTAIFSHSAMPIFLFFSLAANARGALFDLWAWTCLFFVLASSVLYRRARNVHSAYNYRWWHGILCLYFFMRSSLLGAIILFVPMEVHSYTYIIISMFTVFIAMGIISLSRHTLPFLCYVLPMFTLPVSAMLIQWDGGVRFVAFAYAALMIPVYIAFRSTSIITAGNLISQLRHDKINNVLAAEKEDAEIARDVALNANLRKSRFFAAANHDLRQPLYALSLLSRQLGKSKSDTASEELHQQVQTSVESLCTMIDSLLDVSQLDSKSISITATTFSLADLFAHIRGEFSLLARDKGLSFSVHHTPACTTTDQVQLERILRNLVHNAIKYTEQGRVIVGVRHRKDQYEIQVIDSGPGIKPDDIEHIFDEFYQVGDAVRDRDNGVGLGLSIVKRLSTLLQHPLSVTSVPGRGSCFSIIVPQSLCPHTESYPTIDTTFNLDGIIALIIDDDVSVLHGLRTLLEEWNATVFSSESGDEAVSLLDAEGILPDILICDYRLRGSELGTDVIERLRTMLEHAVPALIVTADPISSIVIEDSKTPIELLQKPVNPAKLFNSAYRLTHGF